MFFPDVIVDIKIPIIITSILQIRQSLTLAYDKAISYVINLKKKLYQFIKSKPTLIGEYHFLDIFGFP